jgi:hypothetical protein
MFVKHAWGVRCGHGPQGAPAIAQQIKALYQELERVGSSSGPAPHPGAGQGVGTPVDAGSPVTPVVAVPLARRRSSVSVQRSAGGGVRIDGLAAPPGALDAAAGGKPPLPRRGSLLIEGDVISTSAAVSAAVPRRRVRRGAGQGGGYAPPTSIRLAAESAGPGDAASDGSAGDEAEAEVGAVGSEGSGYERANGAHHGHGSSGDAGASGEHGNGGPGPGVSSTPAGSDDDVDMGGGLPDLDVVLSPEFMDGASAGSPASLRSVGAHPSPGHVGAGPELNEGVSEGEDDATQGAPTPAPPPPPPGRGNARGVAPPPLPMALPGPGAGTGAGADADAEANERALVRELEETYTRVFHQLLEGGVPLVAYTPWRYTRTPTRVLLRVQEATGAELVWRGKCGPTRRMPCVLWWVPGQDGVRPSSR